MIFLSIYEYKISKNNWQLLSPRAKTRMVMPYPDPPVDITSKEFCRILHLPHIPFHEVPPDETPWATTIQNAQDSLPAGRQ